MQLPNWQMHLPVFFVSIYHLLASLRIIISLRICFLICLQVIIPAMPTTTTNTKTNGAYTNNDTNPNPMLPVTSILKIKSPTNVFVIMIKCTSK